jgi:hypothetical protein
MNQKSLINLAQKLREKIASIVLARSPPPAQLVGRLLADIAVKNRLDQVLSALLLERHPPQQVEAIRSEVMVSIVHLRSAVLVVILMINRMLLDCCRNGVGGESSGLSK